MKRLFGIAFAAVLFLLPFPHVVAAAPVCGDRDRLIDILDVRYGEKPVSVGVTVNGGVIEVFASADGETWTILFTPPAGSSCVIATGDAWLEVGPVFSGPAT